MQRNHNFATSKTIEVLKTLISKIYRKMTCFVENMGNFVA